ncbi:hypothetical protein CASFOL_032808 [Castilleja foliolosa]|uniref:F-box domain-containing protein n=1 Tax=Castilleja foliolosa TaxID=1961234 RepID=A0ABD3C358_9LAMI
MAPETTVDVLPEECLSTVLSFTCPRDTCSSAIVSGMFRSASDSDLTWDKFLPADYRQIVARSASPVDFASKKELFAKLCSTPLLIDGGNKYKNTPSTFSVDKHTNKKCYMLSARELSITWSTNSLCWCWKPFPHSRFGETAELITVCRLEIRGKINTQMLSPNTTYGAYLVVQIANRAFGLSVLPSEVSVEVGDYKTRGKLYMNHEDGKRNEIDTSEGEERVLCTRGDGWLEVELGEFYNGVGEKEVIMEFKEVKSEHLKGGLIVEGIEIRPKY